jgi:hypothetical protein
LNYGLIFGLSYGLIYGLIFGLRGSRQSSEIDIETVGALRWSWYKASIGGLLSGIVGFLFGLIVGPTVILSKELIEILFYGLLGGLIFGAMLAPMGVVLNGLRREIIETKSVPNQGIWLSIRNAIFGGLIVALIIGPSAGLIIGLSYGLNEGPNDGLSEGLSQGLIIGLFSGLMGILWYGGLDVIQHYTLRLILLIQGHTPANYARFLDYAVDRIFLQKVGGGYRFIHRLLLEHFVEMGNPLLPPPNPQEELK